MTETMTPARLAELGRAYEKRQLTSREQLECLTALATQRGEIERLKAERDALRGENEDVRATNARHAQHVAALGEQAAALKAEATRFKGIISYIQECEGGPHLLTEAGSLAADRQDEVRQDLAEAQAEVERLNGDVPRWQENVAEVQAERDTERRLRMEAQAEVARLTPSGQVAEDEQELTAWLAPTDGSKIGKAPKRIMAALSRLAAKAQGYEAAHQETRAIEAAVVRTIGGMVEGAPTSRINYRQRLRVLVEKEQGYEVAAKRADTLEMRLRDFDAETEQAKAQRAETMADNAALLDRIGDGAAVACEGAGPADCGDCGPCHDRAI